MKTENEKTKLKNIEKQLSQVMLSFHVKVDGEDVDKVSPELRATFIGVPLSVIDALFAIRDNDPWRDITDPCEIARELLRTTGIGD